MNDPNEPSSGCNLTLPISSNYDTGNHTVIPHATFESDSQIISSPTFKSDSSFCAFDQSMNSSHVLGEKHSSSNSSNLTTKTRCPSHKVSEKVTSFLDSNSNPVGCFENDVAESFCQEDVFQQKDKLFEDSKTRLQINDIVGNTLTTIGLLESDRSALEQLVNILVNYKHCFHYLHRLWCQQKKKNEPDTSNALLFDNDVNKCNQDLDHFMAKFACKDVSSEDSKISVETKSFILKMMDKPSVDCDNTTYTPICFDDKCKKSNVWSSLFAELYDKRQIETENETCDQSLEVDKYLLFSGHEGHEESFVDLDAQQLNEELNHCKEGEIVCVDSQTKKERTVCFENSLWLNVT